MPQKNNVESCGRKHAMATCIYQILYVHTCTCTSNICVPIHMWTDINNISPIIYTYREIIFSYILLIFEGHLITECWFYTNKFLKPKMNHKNYTWLLLDISFKSLNAVYTAWVFKWRKSLFILILSLF